MQHILSKDTIDDKTLNVAIVGGGKACYSILRVLLTRKLPTLKINIMGVCDIKDDSPGIVYAKKMNIFTTNHYRNFFSDKLKVDIIIEITGDDKVLEEIIREKPEHIKILDHIGAKLLWELIEILDEKIALEEHLSVSSKMIAVSEMAYRFVDQIKNPLVSTGGLLKRMILNPDTPHQFRKQLQIVMSNIEKIEKILSDICDLAKPIKINFQIIDFLGMINAWCKGISIEAKKLNIKLDYHIDNDIPDFMLDKDLISQVLWHVAERAMERISRIKGKLEIWVRMCLDEVVIILEEIPHDELKTNDLNYQDTRSTILGGYIPKRTGFWLNICRKIMFDHGGDIRIEHLPSGITSYIIIIPFKFKDRVETLDLEVKKLIP